MRYSFLLLLLFFIYFIFYLVSFYDFDSLLYFISADVMVQGEQKIAGLKLVREETLKKSDSKMQRMHLLEKLIGGIPFIFLLSSLFPLPHAFFSSFSFLV